MCVTFDFTNASIESYDFIKTHCVWWYEWDLTLKRKIFFLQVFHQVDAYLGLESNISDWDKIQTFEELVKLPQEGRGSLLHKLTSCFIKVRIITSLQLSLLTK